MVMVSKFPRRDLSLKETALLSGVTEKAIRHELASRVARASRSRGRRRFSPREVVYFSLVCQLPIALDKRLRRDLFQLLAANKERAGQWRRDSHRLVLEGQVPVFLPTDEVVKRVEDRIGAFLRGRDRVVSRPEVLGGEPVFDGTRIAVRFVGERARNGESLEALLEDSPALSADDIDFARMYVALGRPPGRPRKKPRFVRG